MKTIDEKKILLSFLLIFFFQFVWLLSATPSRGLNNNSSTAQRGSYWQ